MPNTVGLHPRLALVPSRPVAEEVVGWPAWLLTAKDIVEAALVAAQDGTTARQCMTPETWLEQWRTAHRGTSAFAAAATNASSSTSQPRIPRLVMQTTRNASAAATASLPRSEWMRSWRRLNPEYEHVLLDDADGRDFVLRFGSDAERLAYEQALTPQSRADLLRLLWLRELGGWYADTDVALYRPLRELLSVGGGGSAEDRDDDGGEGRGTSAVALGGFSMETMAFEPHHPFLIAALALATSRVSNETAKLRSGCGGGPGRTGGCCRGPEACVIRTTGPKGYMSAIIAAAPFLGCEPDQRQLPSARRCARSPLHSVRNILSVPRVLRALTHFDCRFSAERRDCGASHYSVTRSFFNASVVEPPPRTC